MKAVLVSKMSSQCTLRVGITSLKQVKFKNFKVILSSDGSQEVELEAKISDRAIDPHHMCN